MSGNDFFYIHLKNGEVISHPKPPTYQNIGDIRKMIEDSSDDALLWFIGEKGIEIMIPKKNISYISIEPKK